MKVISIVGSSGSGKTTLIKKLIPELKKRGLKVAVIKHASGKIQFDRKGKDSEVIFKAGTDAVAVFSEKETAVRLKNLPLKRLLDFFKDYDLVVTEGFKKEKFPKIEASNSKKNNIIAVVGDKKLKLNLPFFKNNEIEKISNYIVKRFFRR